MHRLMSKTPFILFVLGLLFSCMNMARASDISPDIDIPDSKLSFGTAEAEMASGEIIGEGWQIYSGIACDSNLNNPNERENFEYFMIRDGSSRETGLTINYDGVSFPVYASTVKGIGYAWGFREEGQRKWQPLLHGTNGLKYEIHKPSPRLNLEIAYARVRVDGIPPLGKTNITRDARAFIQCYKMDNKNIIYYGYVSNGYTDLTSTASTCEIDTRRLNVDLGEHDLNEVNKLSTGSHFGSAEENVDMRCNAGIRVYVSIGEYGRTPSIGRDVIELTDNSNSPGYGVQVFHGDDPTPLKIGGDSNVIGKYHRFLFRSEQGNKLYSVPFIFKYIKTAYTVKPSSGNAALTMTFVYD
ncbi:pilus assembly protein FimA [Providencia sp. 21OH12SH02B-Prov]|uniref:fimbrial protein n=1 Tax=Providencia sp. 21OH12SH02B-Prov TaxID=3015951 RepID=UPI0022B70B79|nr:pilus assembly protein FimA [Providencia sp. 21OH12SH02B-Prov]WBA58058.1 pilus assembly protein FimA [Providencia sp. 21OH12SH02B-Prov]